MPFTEKEQKKLEELERTFEVLNDPHVQTSPSLGGVFAVLCEKKRREKELGGLVQKIADLRAKKNLSEMGKDPDANCGEFYKVRAEEEKKILDAEDE